MAYDAPHEPAPALPLDSSSPDPVPAMRAHLHAVVDRLTDEGVRCLWRLVGWWITPTTGPPLEYLVKRCDRH